jgi:hypothetical protein
MIERAMVYLLFGSGLLWFIIFSIAPQPMQAFSIMFWSLKYSLPAAALCFASIAMRFDAQSRTPKSLRRVAIGLMWFPILGWSIACLTNSALDRSPAASLTFHVMSKPSYARHPFLIVASTRSPGSSKRLEVSRDLYDAVTPGKSDVIVAMKPGYLGFPWIVSRTATP